MNADTLTTIRALRASGTGRMLKRAGLLGKVEARLLSNAIASRRSKSSGNARLRSPAAPTTIDALPARQQSYAHALMRARFGTETECVREALREPGGTR